MIDSYSINDVFMNAFNSRYTEVSGLELDALVEAWQEFNNIIKKHYLLSFTKYQLCKAFSQSSLNEIYIFKKKLLAYTYAIFFNDQGSEL